MSGRQAERPRVPRPRDEIDALSAQVGRAVPDVGRSRPHPATRRAHPAWQVSECQVDDRAAVGEPAMIAAAGPAIWIARAALRPQLRVGIDSRPVPDLDIDQAEPDSGRDGAYAVDESSAQVRIELAQSLARVAAGGCDDSLVDQVSDPLPVRAGQHQTHRVLPSWSRGRSPARPGPGSASPPTRASRRGSLRRTRKGEKPARRGTIATLRRGGAARRGDQCPHGEFRACRSCAEPGAPEGADSGG